MGTLKSSLSSGLAKGQKAAEKQKRKGQQTAGGGKKSAAAYSAAPAKRHAEEPETVKSESTPVYTAAKKSSSANAAVASSMHYSSSGSKHGGSHGSLGEVSVYEQRRQQRAAARKDFWNHTLDLLGTASAQAGRGITGISVPVEQQLEESRRQIENVRAISEANARFEATRKPIEWEGRAELISALEQLDMQSGWEINEEQANAAEQQRQELLARLREGDLAAGNGERSGTDADTGRDILESTAKGIAGAGVNAFSNLGQLMAKADAYTYSENEFLTDWMLGNDPSVMRQARIDAYNDPANQEKWREIDAIADRLDNDAATVLRRAKEGKSIAGEAGVDIVEKLVVELAESDTGRGMLRFLAGAAGEGAEEVVSDLLSPLAEATYRDESLAELYRQLEPSEVLYDYLIGAAISTLASGASAATRQSGEASPEYRANEAEYLNILERNGLLPPESSKNAAHEGAAEDSEQNVESRSLSQHKISGLSGLDAAEDEGSSSALHTYHDPIREKIGSAFQSHPKAMSKILKTLEHRGIEVEYRPGSMSYSPNSESGKPGKLIMDPDASYSAWLHELQHLADDEASGWQGMHILAADQMRALEFEERAYRLEIDFAKKNGYSKIAKRLERLLFERRQEILGTQRNNKQSQA